MECAGPLDTGGNGDWYTENKRGSTERKREITFAPVKREKNQLYDFH
jgi:hypothetical protein